jgi:SAM-dependent methyltransferase
VSIPGLHDRPEDPASRSHPVSTFTTAPVAPEVRYAAGSFRDRTARVFHDRDRVLRAMSATALAEWRAVSQQRFYQQLATQGDVIPTWELSPVERPDQVLPDWVQGVVEHQRIPFISYPYEWCFSMLREAALLHLRILTAALASGVLLKDATPYNVQFQGCQPTFIDVASFVGHSPDEPWSGYRQFCEMQLNPLLVQAYRGIDFQPFLRGELEGLSAQQAGNLFSWRDSLRPGVATHVWLHGWMQSAVSNGAGGAKQSLQSSGFSAELIAGNLKRLTRLVEGLRWTPRRSTWSDYETAQPHVHRDRELKSAFVRDVCGARSRDLVWDLGCNRGQYSRIAAETATTVVAMDQDHGCVEQFFLDLRRNGPVNILPLRIDLANPSPGLGWRGRERLRLEERGRPDLVLCLGLIHHLVIGANLPLADVVDWLSELRGEVVIEFPTKADPLVQSLLCNKPDQYEDYSLAELERCLSERFVIDRRATLPSGERHLIHARPRT